jgi:poly(A) polymerase
MSAGRLSISPKHQPVLPSEVAQLVARAVPEVVIRAAERLNCELYAVGGCIRDPILGRPIGDIDFAVVGDATQLAREISRALEGSRVAIYARFGTAMVRLPERNLEFATARRESYQAESRKPDQVTWVPIEEDLGRRDFTINAICLGLSGPRAGEVLDLFSGLEDLSRKVLRTPLNPEATFSDDPLRMLRAIRFAAEYDFRIEPSTWDGIRGHAHRLNIVARERIGDEFRRMVAGRDPVQAMKLLVSSGIMGIILPEVTNMAGVEQVNRHHHKDVLLHSLRVMQNVVDATPDPMLRLAALLHDIGKPATKRLDPELGWTFHGHEIVGARLAFRVGRRLRLGRDNLDRMVRLVRLHMRPVNLTSEGVSDSAIRRLMVEAGDDLEDQLLLCRADITTANPDLVDRYLANFDEMALRIQDVEARDKLRRFQSPVRGEEIMELCGIGAGPMIGALKERVEDAILDGIIPNEYEAARLYLLKIKDQVLTTPPEELGAERRQRAQSRRRITRDFDFPGQ